MSANVQVVWIDPVTYAQTAWPAVLLWAGRACRALDVALLRLLPHNSGAAALKYAHEGTGGTSRASTGPTLESVGAVEAVLPLKEEHLGLPVGSRVVAVGHSLVAPHMGLPPSLTFGCISVLKRMLKDCGTGGQEVVERQGTSAAVDVPAELAACSRCDSSNPVTMQQYDLGQVGCIWKHRYHAADNRASLLARRAADRLRGGNVSKARTKDWQARAHTLKPALIITDAAIHAGCSGGGLFSATDDGEGQAAVLLGLVTSHARHFRGSSVPSIGYVLPVDQFEHIIRHCKIVALQGGSDMMARLELEALDVPVVGLDTLWDSHRQSEPAHFLRNGAAGTASPARSKL
jgi:hypothetical protein